jgi:peptide deformylase
MSDRKIKFVDGNMVTYEIMPLVDKYDPILRQKMTPVDFETMSGHEIAFEAMSLMESLNHYHGVGLSANQIGLKHRMCAVSVDDKVWSLINPVIIDKSITIMNLLEGCLSFPGLFLKIGRPDWVEVEFNAANGDKMNKRFEGLLSIVVQHEMDHLDGIVYTDLVSPTKLEMARRKVKTNLRKIKRNIATINALSS